MREVNILIIEDTQDLAKLAEREIIDGFEHDNEVLIRVSIETDFDEGYEKFKQGGCDVVILDVRRDAAPGVEEHKTAGYSTYNQMRIARFAPVIFWTALPEEVLQEEMPPLVAVVPKDDIEKLPGIIRTALKSRAVQTISEIEDHVSRVLREHMWTELGPNWSEYTLDSDSKNIAHILLSRVVRVLENDREENLASLPSQRYLYPAVSNDPAPGDLLLKSDGTWWITLTPACDFAQHKTEYALLARADALANHPKYLSWKVKFGQDSEKPEDRRAKSEWNSLRQDILASTRGRFYYLPKFRQIPDLVVDLDHVVIEPVNNLPSFNKIASLSSPFAESLITQHSQHRGRIGIPDIDIDIVKKRLSEFR